MHIYRILIFFTNDNIHVVETLDKCTIKKIGFHGNEYFRYENITDIDMFYEELTDHYNVNDLSEINMHIYVIDCKANKQSVMTFLHKTSSCNHVSVYKVEDVIPAILTQKELHKNVDDICIIFLDNKYTYSIADNCYYLKESSNVDKEITLSFLDFNSLIFWSKYNSSDLNKKLEEKTNIIKENEALLSQKNQEIDKLKNEMLSLSKTLAPIKEELLELTAYKKNREFIDHRVVVRATSLPDKYRSRLSYSSSTFTLFVVEEVEDGTVVSKGQEIGWLKETKRKKIKTDWHIYSPRSGKIAWLQENGEQIHIKGTGDWYRKELGKETYPIVAIVGDSDDTVDAMKEWYYKSFKKNNRPHI